MSQELSLVKCKVSPVGLVIYESASFTDWQQIGKTLSKVEHGLMWWVGDWVNFGEQKYGEKYSQLTSPSPQASRSREARP